MIELGFFGDPVGTAEYHRQRRVIEALSEYHSRIPNPIPESSEWVALESTEPRGPVSLTVSLSYGLDAARGCLQQIITLIEEQVPSNAIVFQTLLRTALMGGGHVLYVLGPTSPDERRSNAQQLRFLETRSHSTAIKTIADFSAIDIPRPSDDDLAAIDRLRSEVRQGHKGTNEGPLLREMVAVLASQVADANFDGHSADAMLRDLIGWTWNVYSGLAHGYGWPFYLPSSTPEGFTRMPGDFSADMALVVTITHLAFDRAVRLSQPETAGMKG